MNFILIDGSYFIFYRVHALLLWWKHAKSGEILSKPEETEEFMQKYKSTFVDKIKEIPKKLKLKKDDQYIMLVGKDCPQNLIWRKKLFADYKGNRDKNEELNIKDFFMVAYDELFQKSGVGPVLSYPSLEADDCIAITTKHLLETYEDCHVYIIASDMDYSQLVQERVTIIDLKYKKLTDSKTCCEDAEKNLFCKIVSGDKSDNIPSIMPRCGYKTAVKYYDDRELFNKKLAEKKEYKIQYELNENLVSFKKIPQDLINLFRQDCLGL